jgi:hypothetical protein
VADAEPARRADGRAALAATLSDLISLYLDGGREAEAREVLASATVVALQHR